MVGILILGGCATPAANVKTELRTDELAPFCSSGSGALFGQSFMKTRGGEVRSAAGNWVVLVPDLPYTREMLRLYISVGRQMALSEFGNAARKCMGDSAGNYEFQKVPAGNYLLFCEIYWDVPGRYGGRTGGLVYKYITLRDGERKKFILTPGSE